MKLLLISAFFPPEVGSAAHLFYELGQAFRARGHEVLVLTGLPRYHVAESAGKVRRAPVIREDYHGLRVFRVFNLDIPWNAPVMRGLDQFVSAGCAGLAGLCLPRFDAALVYSPPLPLALAALACCRLRGRPLVVNIQDLFPQSAIDLGVLRQPHLIRLFRTLESLLYRRADHVVVHSRGNRDYLTARGAPPGRVCVVSNWVDTEAVRPSPRDNALRAQLGLDGRFVVSFAGIMGYSQDLDTVVESARLLRDRPDIVFLLVGDGVEKPGLEARVRRLGLSNVRFLPMQPREKYPEVLAASDLCLVTLRPEVRTPVVPSKILSIMAAGRPVLASLPLMGDAPALIREAGCGVAVPPAQPAALSRAVADLADDAPARAAMGDRGRDYAQRHLSLSAISARLERLLHNLIHEQPVNPTLSL